VSTHAGYILAAYGFTALVVAAVVVWSLVQYRLNARALAELEARLGRSE
jgi:heme exporter protein CcmD